MPSWSEASKAGTLFVVGTPIGNLGDMTLRAIETLKLVDTIAAEDTRHTRKLLSHFEIHGKSLVSIESHVSKERIDSIVEQLRNGRRVALVTDAGMPSISDPGAQLTTRAHDAGIGVVVIPGPSALTASVAASGCVDGPFLFLGFLPRQAAARLRILHRIRDTLEPVVLFESPNRMRSTLSELCSLMPQRPAVVCRELTKLHEQILRSDLITLASREDEWRGEMVLVLGPGEAPERAGHSSLPSDEQLLMALGAGETPRDIIASLELKGAERRTLYSRLVALRASLLIPPK